MPRHEDYIKLAKIKEEGFWAGYYGAKVPCPYFSDEKMLFYREGYKIGAETRKEADRINNKHKPANPTK